MMSRIEEGIRNQYLYNRPQLRNAQLKIFISNTEIRLGILG